MLNTTENWKKIMVALPDGEFFAIMRNYLGKLNTPFNKHLLIDDLADFLLRDETEKRILSMIDEEDALILTSIDFLSGTDIHELHDFLGSDRSFMSIHHLLLNLEERLLIYRDSDNGRIRISPLFENLFKDKIFNADLLFPSKENSKTKHPDLWFTDTLVTAFISFIFKHPDLLKLDGTLKKKAHDDITKIFPNLLADNSSPTRLDLLLRGLKNLLLVKEIEEEIIPDEYALKQLSELGIQERYMLYSASIIQSDIKLSSINDFAEIINKFLNAIPRERNFPHSSITKLLLLILKKYNIKSDKSEIILNAIISSNLLVSKENGYEVNSNLNGIYSLEEIKEPPIIVQTSFDLTVKPWLSLKDGIKFACLTEIKKFDIYPDFELNRASYTKGHDCKLYSKDIIKTLENLSGRPIPQNIQVSVKSWEEEYNRIKIYEGIVLSVNSEKQVIIEHLQNLQIYIKKKLAPGIYLMDTENIKEWKIIIENAGINVPVIQKANTDTDIKEHTILYSSGILNDSDFLKIPVSTNRIPVEKYNFKDDLNKKLNTINLSKDELTGFRIRIDKKLILYPEQIQHGNIRTEKTEASGMDYSGKIRLIERAIQSKSELLEISFGNPIEKIITYLVKPDNLDKSKEDLILNAITLPEENKIQLIVRKMSKVKRLKSSLFAPQKEKVDL